MGVIYQRAHGRCGGMVIFRDDCLPRSAQQQRERQHDVQQAVLRALDGMVARHGAEAALQMLISSPYNPDTWTAEELERHEEVQRTKAEWQKGVGL